MEKTENQKIKYLLAFLAIVIPASLTLYIHLDNKKESATEPLINIEQKLDSTSNPKIETEVNQTRNTLNNEGNIGTVIQSNSGPITIENNFNEKIDTIEE